MAFKKEKRERIKRYLLESIFDKDINYVRKTAECFDISLNTVYRYLKELKQDNLIHETEKKYKLIQSGKAFKYDLSKGKLEEHEIYYRDIAPFIDKLENNIRNIWEYSFMEMFNNVIDHSSANTAVCAIRQNHLYTWINIKDNGVGIFKKIKDYYNYSSLEEAISELFKGKLTTDSNNHSGEGIFFTSHILDMFAAISDNKIFSHSNTYDEILDISRENGFSEFKDTKGTLIIMAISNFSAKQLREVFDMFSDESGSFVKTQIPLKNFCENGYPVSRSQAKRLISRFDRFKEIILDFGGVLDIGQGFAHELFVVFKNNHPDIKLTPINVSDNVQKMLNHVLIP